MRNTLGCCYDFVMEPNEVFVAYPSKPLQLRNTIGEAISELSAERFRPRVMSWEEMDIPGRFIHEEVMEHIDSAEFVVADITRLNFNVTFEVGYALGRSKRVVLTVNESLSPPMREITQLGIYDNLGHASYENSSSLAQIIRKIEDVQPLRFPVDEIDHSAPIFVLDTVYKTDASVRITSKIKKARIRYRSFDPKEQPRLSTLEAYRSVKKSIAVVVHLLSSNATDRWLNNLRAAFLTGLSYGLERELLVFQEGEEPVPLDYRELVAVYQYPRDIDDYINDLAPRVVEGLQTVEEGSLSSVQGLLANLDLGATAAENEIQTLGDYYVATHEFGQVTNGAARLAVGRKGSGKSALFFQARDKLRSHKPRMVLDLKPEGHQLARLKALVLELLESAVQEHAIAAFWEYVLLLELCNKILEKDRKVHLRNHNLTELYQDLRQLYTPELLAEGGDFSERMLRLVNRIGAEFQERYGDGDGTYLSPDQVTGLIYTHDIPELREQLTEYLLYKDDVYIFIDNIDKGWPTRGVEGTDILILRSLLEATRKLEQFFKGRGISLHTTVFIRNDVFELLVDASPDRGKESRVSLDWTDADLLRELLRRRLTYNGLIPEDATFSSAWRQICTTHISGEETSEFLINRSLMRPRNFLTLVNHCRSNAVNLQHDKILVEDITKAVSSYSADIGSEIGLEIRDVFPSAEDILYYFIGFESPSTLREVRDALEQSPVPREQLDQLIEILLWFGFLGVGTSSGGETDETYIYDVYYDMKKLRWLAGNLQQGDAVLHIHRAFWPFLGISG